VTDYLKELKRVGHKYLASMDRAEQQLQEVADLIWEAQEDGVTIRQIAQASGLSRTKVYTIINREADRRQVESRNARVRAWLRSQGREVHEVGEISASLIEDYNNAMKRKDER